MNKDTLYYTLTPETEMHVWGTTDSYAIGRIGYTSMIIPSYSVPSQLPTLLASYNMIFIPYEVVQWINGQY